MHILSVVERPSGKKRKTPEDRITVTLAKEIKKDLESWAAQEGRPTANLAAFLLELAVKRKFKNKYPDVEDPGSNGSDQ